MHTKYPFFSQFSKNSQPSLTLENQLPIKRYSVSIPSSIHNHLQTEMQVKVQRDFIIFERIFQTKNSPQLYELQGVIF